MASEHAGGLSVHGMVVAAMVAVATLVGLTVDGVYRDNVLVRSSWRGTDLVSLAVAVPLLVSASVATRRGSGRGTLVCLGMLAYTAYNYAFYLFGAAFNGLFLVYVGILIASTLGLIFGLSSPRVRTMVGRVDRVPAGRSVGWLVTTVALVLGIFWLATSAAYLRTGQVPAMVTATAHPTNVTGALDLWLVVTFGLLGGVWLIRGRPWGFAISVVWTVKGAVYMTALGAASYSAHRAGATDGLMELALWIPIGVACLAGAVTLLRAREPFA